MRKHLVALLAFVFMLALASNAFAADIRKTMVGVLICGADSCGIAPRPNDDNYIATFPRGSREAQILYHTDAKCPSHRLKITAFVDPRQYDNIDEVLSVKCLR